MEPEQKTVLPLKPVEQVNTKGMPVIIVGYSDKCQDVALDFDTTQFRKYEFVIAVLKMATEKAEHALRTWRINEAAKQQQEMMQQAMMEEQLRQADPHRGRKIIQA